MDNKNIEYRNLFINVSEIINKIDPEDLEPGAKNGAPLNEYDAETAKIVAYIVHNQEEIKLNKGNLTNKISQVWEESFGENCPDAEAMTQEIIKIIF